MVHACVSVLRNVGKVQKLCFVVSFVVGEVQVDLEHRRGAAASTFHWTYQRLFPLIGLRLSGLVTSAYTSEDTKRQGGTSQALYHLGQRGD
jgi:hypothetical protein